MQPVAAPEDHTITAPWPLGGRSGELRLLTALFSRPDARGMVLAGPAGVGKTRLANEFLLEAERRGLGTAQASASRAAAALPFGALASLLPLAEAASASAGNPDRAALLGRFVASMSERGNGRRLALLVDDAHLLDDASATLVYQLAASDAALLLVTIRTGEPAPDPVLALWKDGLLDRVELEGLDGLSVGELLTSVLGGPVDPATVARLAARCRGNVLYLRELVLGAVATGALTAEGGLWHLTRPLAASGRLIELIQARLTGLDDAGRAVLEAVALGEPLSAAELAAVADVSAAEALEAAGLLTSRLDGRRLEFHLAHPLHGEVLRARISGLHRRTLTGRLAAALEATGGRRAGDELRLATWRLDSGGGPPELLLRAAQSPRAHSDYPLAERLARAAAQDGAGIAAAVLAARLAGLAGRGEEADAELAALGERATGDDELGPVVVARVENLHRMGRFAGALAIAEEASTTLTDPRWRDELAAHRAGILLHTDGPAAAAEAAAQVCANGTGPATGWACLISTLALTRTGRLMDAAEAAETGHRTLQDTRGQSDWSRAVLPAARAGALAHAGLLGQAEALAADEHDRAVADGPVDVQAFAARELAHVLLLQGRVDAAARYGREAAALLRQLGQHALLRDCLAGLATTEALGGNSAAAAELLAELDALSGDGAWTGADAGCARAWTAAAGGDIPTARAHLQDAASLGQSTGDQIGEAAALHDLARLGFPSEASKRLTALAEQIDGELVSVRAAHTAALARHDATGLEKASATFEILGALLFAAEAAADAAAAYHRAGDSRRAAAASRRAVSLADRCESARTPALDSIEARGLLTPGERQVALLAAGGRSNREIAAALTLSLRTVENRLHRIYEKLGIPGRAALAEALQD